jgi:hypothetical protein
VQKRVGTRRARIAVLVPALVLLGVLAHVAGATSPPDHQITLCHATDSYTNPYVVITVDVASVRFAGHEGHDGPIFFPAIAKHTKWGDIIPPASNDGTRAVIDLGGRLRGHGPGLHDDERADDDDRSGRSHDDDRRSGSRRHDHHRTRDHDHPERFVAVRR